LLLLCKQNESLFSLIVLKTIRDEGNVQPHRAQNLLSVYSETFVRNIFHPNKYLASCNPDTRRSARNFADFHETANMKCHENLCGGSQLLTSGQADTTKPSGAKLGVASLGSVRSSGL
jgi:hypothetical protein